MEEKERVLKIWRVSGGKGEGKVGEIDWAIESHTERLVGGGKGGEIDWRLDSKGWKIGGFDEKKE